MFGLCAIRGRGTIDITRSDTMETETVVEVHSKEPQPNSTAANDFSDGEFKAENAGETANAVIQPLTTPLGEIKIVLSRSFISRVYILLSVQTLLRQALP